MTKKKKVIIISAGAALLVVLTLLTAFFASGNLFGTPVSDGGENPACELIVEGGTTTRYDSVENALKVAKLSANMHKNLTVKLLRDCEVKTAVYLPTHDTAYKLTFDLNGHKLSRNLTDYVEDGEVITTATSGDFVITDSVGGGSISGGKSITGGGGLNVGVSINSLKITVDGVTFKDNASCWYGGGISLELSDCATYILKDVTVTGNTAELDGGGVYLRKTSDNNNAVKLIGTNIIKDNEGGNLLLDNNNCDTKMLDASELSSSEIYIDYIYQNDGCFVLDLGDDVFDTVLSCFKANNSSYNLEKSGSSIRMTFREGIAIVKWKGRKFSYDSIPNAWADINNPNKYGKGDVVLVLNENWTADENKNLDTNVTTDVCGFSQGRLFPEGRSDGSTLTLDLNGHTIDRLMGAEDRDYGNILSIERDLKIVVKNGTLTGGHNDYDGGGVYINAAGAYVTFDNITIRNCKSDDYGGGVYMSGNANHVTFKDCTITNNETNEKGGGIWMYCADGDDRDILLTGKVVIEGNWEQFLDVFTYKHRENNLYFKDGHRTRGPLLFPTLTEGSSIGVCFSSPNELTKRAADTAENRRCLSYFHKDESCGMGVNIAYVGGEIHLSGYKR